jgi:hypothetical protein
MFLHLTEENFKILYKRLVYDRTWNTLPRCGYQQRKKDIEAIEYVQRRALKLVSTFLRSQLPREARQAETSNTEAQTPARGYTGWPIVI